MGRRMSKSAYEARKAELQADRDEEFRDWVEDVESVLSADLERFKAWAGRLEEGELNSLYNRLTVGGYVPWREELKDRADYPAFILASIVELHDTASEMRLGSKADVPAEDAETILDAVDELYEIPITIEFLR